MTTNIPRELLLFVSIMPVSAKPSRRLCLPWTSSQSWSLLQRHARNDIAKVRLHELCKDSQRVQSLVAVYNTKYASSSSSSSSFTNSDTSNDEEERLWIVDLSRQRLTLETLRHLLTLAVSCNTRHFIQQLAWGHVQGSRQQQQQQQPYLSTVSQTNSSATFQDPHHPRSTRFVEPTTLHPPTTSTMKDDDSSVPSRHLAFRVPSNQGYSMLDSSIDPHDKHQNPNILHAIHTEWERIERVSTAMRRGTWRSSTNALIQTVVVVGKGVAVEALKCVYQALLCDAKATMARKWGMEGVASTAARFLRQRGFGTTSSSQSSQGGRTLRIVSSVDPVMVAQQIADLDPASTFVISVAINGNEETGLAMKLIKTWLLDHLSASTQTTNAATGTSHNNSNTTHTTPLRRADHVLSHHIALVTASERVATAINKPESVYVIPHHSRCEAFVNFSAATLLVRTL